MGSRDANRADVVVIGGGILGCSAAYHLHRAGAGRVVLVERAAESMIMKYETMRLLLLRR
jgi:L-2-hydroxyglutarate oxidase LhgO